MYSDLDDLLSQDTTIDAWYDDGFLIARDILNDFSENDWNILNNSLMSKDLKWQKKLAYAISNQQTPTQSIGVCCSHKVSQSGFIPFITTQSVGV